MKKLIALTLGLMIAGAVYAEGCRSFQYITNGKVVYCNTCCYGGNCQTSCTQPK